MAFVTLSGIRLAGLAACVPQTRARTLDYPWPNERDGEQFEKTVGISERRLATADQTAGDLCATAAEALLNATQTPREAVRLLVLVTQTPDYRLPATATILQHRLGLGKHCLAFDVNLGCSGYVYGLSVAGSLLAHLPEGSQALLLVGDVSSRVVAQTDRSVAPLFSDAGSATLLVKDPEATDQVFHLQTDGAGAEAIIIPHGGLRHPFSAASLEVETTEPGIRRTPADMRLDGLGVFNFSLREVAPNLQQLLDHTGLTTAALDYAVFHQANRLINDSVRRKLGLTAAQTPMSLQQYGNTSSATIPLTLVTELAAELAARPLTLALSGFGVGLSWGSAIIRTQPLTVLPILEA
jgi:3-oxoacyl-[acyl-carrier-protein] synthase-3